MIMRLKYNFEGQTIFLLKDFLRTEVGPLNNRAKKKSQTFRWLGGVSYESSVQTANKRNK